MTLIRFIARSAIGRPIAAATAVVAIAACGSGSSGSQSHPDVPSSPPAASSTTGTPTGSTSLPTTKTSHARSQTRASTYNGHAVTTACPTASVITAIAGQPMKAEQPVGQTSKWPSHCTYVPVAVKSITSAGTPNSGFLIVIGEPDMPLSAVRSKSAPSCARITSASAASGVKYLSCDAGDRATPELGPGTFSFYYFVSTSSERGGLCDVLIHALDGSALGVQATVRAPAPGQFNGSFDRPTVCGMLERIAEQLM